MDCCGALTELIQEFTDIWVGLDHELLCLIQVEQSVDPVMS